MRAGRVCGSERVRVCVCVCVRLSAGTGRLLLQTWLLGLRSVEDMRRDSGSEANETQQPPS